MANADFSRIATNIGALNALNSLNNINSKLGVHQQRLATGKRINSAADDPAGLTIATKLNARAEGLRVAGDNISDAQNLLAVAESGLGRINEILVQMRNKAEQAASDTIGSEERGAIKTQLNAYATQIQDLVDQTTWNGNKLLNGVKGGTEALRFQTGAGKDDATTLNTLVNVGVDSTGLNIATLSTTSSATVAVFGADAASITLSNSVFAGLDSGVYEISISGASNAATVAIKTQGGVTVGSVAGFNASVGGTATLNLVSGGSVTVAIGANSDAIKEAVTYTKASTGYDVGTLASATDYAGYMNTLDTAMTKVSGQLSQVGALSGRLTFKAEQVSVMQVNVESSYNRIMNADMAYEQLEATKFSILQQTSTTMLAQANTAPQGILGLFR